MTADHYDGGSVRSLRSIALTAVLAVSASLLVAPPASAEPTWVPPAKLGAEARYFDMDVNAAGAAVAAWFGGDVLKASYRPAGRDWSRPVVLARMVAGAPGTPVRAHVDASGVAAVVAWDGNREQVVVVTRQPQGGWRQDDRVPSPGSGPWISTPTSDIDAEGNLVLTWVDSDDLRGDMPRTAWRRPSGRWSTTSGGGGYRDIVAHRRTATIVRGGDGVFVQQVPRDGSATAWTKVRPAATAGRPTLEGSSAGDLVLAAVESDTPGGALNAGDPGRLVVMTRAEGGPWVDASESAPRTEVSDPAVAINRRGEVVVTYRRVADGALEAVTGRVGSATLTAPVTLAATSAESPARPAISPAGDVLVTWSASNAGAVGAAMRSTSGTWTSLGSLRGDTLGGHLVRAYPNGMFTALHLDAGALWWSDYVDDTAGPRTTMLAPRHETSTSRSIPVRWHMTDALSRPASADVRVRSGRPGGALGAWTIWKRQVTRESVTFSGRSARRYCFAVRGHDRAGNTGHWSERRCTTTPRG